MRCLALAVLAALLSLAVRAQGAPLLGRVTDGRQGLAGVRVYPDRTRHVTVLDPPPVAVTDAEGRFRIRLDDRDTVLAVEKEGWQRDLVPKAEWPSEIRLRPAPEFRVEKVWVVRLEIPGQKAALPDEALRKLLFSREPGAASAANYLYEVSKGSLVLEEGAWERMAVDKALPEDQDERAQALGAFVTGRLEGRKLGDLDQVDNRTGQRKPDGKPDHLWTFVPGNPQSLTGFKGDLKERTILEPLVANPATRWGVAVMTELVSLGSIVHEAFHQMGENRVDDLYLGCDDPFTAGIWDLMDVGQYRGWDRAHQEKGPWQEDTGYSPSQPGSWVRSELWYHGRFSETVKTLRLRIPSKGGHARSAKARRSAGPLEWTGWIAPLVRAAGADPQRVVLPDPSAPGAFWNLEVRRPWGFDRGRVGNRWGPGYEGLIVSHVDPDLLSDDEPEGPMRIMDAHPGTEEPAPPRFPCHRYELDDAAFNLGEDENPKGSDGPFSWTVLETDAAGRMKVRVALRGK